MFAELHQIKKFLAAHHGLPLDGEDAHASRIVGEVPDGVHTIPLGEAQTPTRVAVRGGKIFIDPKTEKEDLGHVFNVLGRSGTDFFEVLEEIFIFVHGHGLTTEWINRVRAKWPQHFTAGGAATGESRRPRPATTPEAGS